MKEASSVDMKTHNGQSKLRRGGGTLWRRLRGALAALGRDADDRRDPRGGLNTATPPWLAGATSSAAPDEARAVLSQSDEQPPKSGVLLPFPIRGEALLVKLAGVLRNRVEEHGPDRDPLLLTISRRPRSRLSIDRAAYVEFDVESSEYRVAVEASPGMRVIVETADFDALVEFVAQYVATRIAERAALGVAS